MTPDTATLTELDQIFRKYGNIMRSTVFAKAIVNRRGNNPFVKVGDLKDIIYKNEPSHMESARFDTLIKASQALRIVVNKELDNLKKFLEDLPKMAPRTDPALVIMIGFHELEYDIITRYRTKMRKNYKITEFASGERSSQEEIATNSPSRSAKLFAWKFKPKEEAKNS